MFTINCVRFTGRHAGRAMCLKFNSLNRLPPKLAEHGDSTPMIFIRFCLRHTHTHTCNTCSTCVCLMRVHRVARAYRTTYRAQHSRRHHLCGVICAVRSGAFCSCASAFYRAGYTRKCTRVWFWFFAFCMCNCPIWSSGVLLEDIVWGEHCTRLVGHVRSAFFCMLRVSFMYMF